MSRNHEASLPRRAGQPLSDEIVFLDSLPQRARRRQTLTLELQAELDASEVHSPWRSAPLPRFDDDGIDPAIDADVPRRPWGEPAPPPHAQQHGAGTSVAPVAMTSAAPEEPRRARRHVVQGVGYAVLLAAICLAAAGIYRAASPVRRASAAAPNTMAASPVAESPSESGKTEPGTGSPDMTGVDLALGLAWGRAQACLPSRDAGAMVSMKLVLAPDGQVIAAWVTGSRYYETPVGACIARQFLAATIPPFVGESVVIQRSYTIQ
ncbi:MAG: hypothetical protein HY898_31465 [Deltaproteobacteria bacterium]|nr:hypothetical protein [Deltaproteobacteria bacterium]